MEKYWIHDSSNRKLISVDDLETSKPILAFDFDGVLTKPEKAKAKVLQSKGYNITEKQVDGAVAKKIMHQQKPILTEEEISKEYHRTIDHLYAHNMELINPNIELFNLLNNLKKYFDYYTMIVTSRKSTSESPQVQAIGPWLSYINETVDGIINTNMTPKQKILTKIKPLMFIDDSIKKLEELFLDDECTKLPEQLKNTKMLFFYNQGNTSIKPKGNIEPISNMPQLEKRLYEILK